MIISKRGRGGRSGPVPLAAEVRGPDPGGIRRGLQRQEGVHGPAGDRPGSVRGQTDRRHHGRPLSFSRPWGRSTARAGPEWPSRRRSRARPRLKAMAVRRRKAVGDGRSNDGRASQVPPPGAGGAGQEGAPPGRPAALVHRAPPSIGGADPPRAVGGPPLRLGQSRRGGEIRVFEGTMAGSRVKRRVVLYELA